MTHVERRPPGVRRVREGLRVWIAAWKLLRRAAGRELTVVLGSSAVSTVAVVVQLLVGKALLGRLGGTPRGTNVVSLVPLLLGLAVATVAGIAAMTIATERRLLLVELVERHVEDCVVSVVAAVEIERLDDPQFHDQLQRANVAFEDQPWDVVNGVVNSLSSAVGVVAISAVLLPIAPWLVPLVLVFSIPIALVSTRNSRRRYATAYRLAADDRRRLHLKEVLTTARPAGEIRLFGAERYLQPRYRVLAGARVDAFRRLVVERTRHSLIAQVAVGLVGVGGLALLVREAARGTISVADAGIAAIAVQQLTSRLRQMSSAAASMYQCNLFLGDLLGFLDTPVIPAGMSEENRERVRDTDGSADALVTDHVSFTYPGTSREVLEDVSIQIGRGEIVALVGPNGAGKTTLAKILCGLYSPSGGDVLLADGQPGTAAIQGRPQLRSMTTAVFQDFGRFALSARDNIVLADPDRVDDSEALYDAARRAGIHDMLRRLPDGYDTILSRSYEGGTDLSLGQWQRVALARALFRQAPFVVLDEPTAAADAASEARFLIELREACRDRGVLLITHRLSTARRADRTYVLSGGRIVESGTHEELARGRGLYATLNQFHAGA